MKHSAKEGELVLGEYEVTTKLKDNAVYQWVKAIDCKNRHSVVLQLLTLDIKQEALATIFSYFDALQGARRKGLMVPDMVLSDANYPLVVVYSDLPVEPLDSALNQAPERTIEWLHDASETLFALHNKQLVHGHVTPDSFVVADGIVYLTGFGYAPLLQLGHQDALRECDDFLAPEVSDQHSVTSTADVYAFAKTAAHWQPKLATTQWYYQATAPNPSDRFRRMRNLFDALKKAFTALSGSDMRTEHEEEQRTDERPEEKNKGSLIPKYILDVKAEPSEGGRVEGGGSYLADERVTVIAIPTAGWQFEHWSGNLNSAKNSDTLVMDANKAITAQFVKTPQVFLSVSVEPAEAGNVSGSGIYRVGTEVPVKAWSISQKWRFDRWSGAINGSTNPALLIMDTDKYAIAHFVKVATEAGRKDRISSTSVPQWASAESDTDTESKNLNKPEPPPEPQPRRQDVPRWANIQSATEQRNLVEPEPPPETQSRRQDAPKWANIQPATEQTNPPKADDTSSVQPPRQPVSNSAFDTEETQSNTENTDTPPPSRSTQETQNKRVPGKAFQ